MAHQRTSSYSSIPPSPSSNPSSRSRRHIPHLEPPRRTSTNHPQRDYLAPPPPVGLLHSSGKRGSLVAALGYKTVLVVLLATVTALALVLLPSSSRLRSTPGFGKDAAAGLQVKVEDEDAPLTLDSLRAYRKECVGNLKEMIKGGHMHMGGYFGSGHGHPGVGMNMSEAQEGQGHNEAYCARSAIYVLDPSFGLIHQLLHLSILYSLALSDKRAFFVDDSLWDRGTWKDHFLPLPDQGCKRPPRRLWRGCPRSEDHWALTPRTHPFHFGHDWYEEFEDPKGYLVHRRRPMYNMARQGLESILIPSKVNQGLINLAIEELADGGKEVPPYMAVHLRRGDRHAMSWAHHNDYIPEEDVLKLIAIEWGRLLTLDPTLPAKPNIYLTSDSPEAASYLKWLAPNGFRYFSLSTSSHSSLRSISSPSAYFQSTFSTVEPSVRINLTRGMIVDQALLGGGWGFHLDSLKVEGGRRQARPETTLCGLSSTICKLVAIQMGWERSVEEGRWVNYDGREMYDWDAVDVGLFGVH